MATTLQRSTPRRRLPSVLSLFEALATPHGIDRYLELINPLLTVRELRAEVTEVDRSTAGSLTLTLRPTHRWQGFSAGQYVRLTVDIDGVRRTRCYSPACSQCRSDGQIQLTIRLHPDGQVSRYLHEQAVVGMVLGLSQGEGDFGLAEQRPAKVLLVSGGSGITPVLSMLATLRDENYRGEIAFLHFARTEQDVPHLAELRELAAAPNVNLAFGFSAQPDRGELTGRFALEQLAEVAPWYAEAETYVCGPAALIEGAREQYERAGLTHRLHVESFTPLPVVADDGPATGEVSFTGSATVAANSGASLLEQAEAAGLSPAYGCRMGICFSCTAIKTSGCTRNLVTGELDADPDTEIQLCISAPVGDVAVQI